MRLPRNAACGNLAWPERREAAIIRQRARRVFGGAQLTEFGSSPKALIP
jgi:hypothetical protein